MSAGTWMHECSFEVYDDMAWMVRSPVVRLWLLVVSRRLAALETTGGYVVASSGSRAPSHPSFLVPGKCSDTP